MARILRSNFAKPAVLFSPPPAFPSCRTCSPTSDRSSQSLVCSLNSCLLRSASPFPYFMLLSLEAGSPLRAFLLLAVFPFVCLISSCFSHPLALQVLIFVSTAGLPLSEVAAVSKAVLPKFFLDYLYSRAFEIFATCGKRYVVTSYPRVMVEFFLVEHLGVDHVLGTELQVTGRRRICTGLVRDPGVLIGLKKSDAVKKLLGDERPDIALGSGASDYAFMSLAKEAYRIVDAELDADKETEVRRELFRKPLVFHDGRLVQRPTPLKALAIFLWAPVGMVLAIVRTLIVQCLPMELGMPIAAMVGYVIRIKGAPPLPLPVPEGKKKKQGGILFASSHRTLLDPAYICVGLRRNVRALVYSISRVSRALSPIKTTSLSRDREQDRELISGFLKADEDLILCPEGTTCREPYLLRFSPLFAELTEHIVPVGMKVKVSMFHGTSARGYKALDPFFFLMNPRPEYEIMFMERLKEEETVAGGGKSGVEVAMSVQRKLAEALGFTCTDLTRRDKYMVLAGNDGRVAVKAKKPPRLQST